MLVQSEECDRLKWESANFATQFAIEKGYVDFYKREYEDLLKELEEAESSDWYMEDNIVFYVELHTHTAPASSDSQLTTEDIVIVAKNAGLDGVVISNHYNWFQLNRFKGTYEEKLDAWFSDIPEAKAVGKRLGLKVFAGMEYHVDDSRHFGVIGLTEKIFQENPPEPDGSLSYLLGWARECKILLIQNHAYRPGNEFCPVSGIGYELYNTKYINPDPHALARQTFENAIRFSHTFVCGSDAHSSEHIGTSATVFSSSVRDERDLKERIEKQEQLLALNIGNICDLRKVPLLTTDFVQYFR